MNRDEVSSKFNQVAKAYDDQRKQLIPCFDDFYNIAIDLANVKTNTPNILDLGAGTGLFSELILKKYPQSTMTLIDISEKMLDVAKLRLQEYKRVNYLLEDYISFSAAEKFDIIISALSIHHLTDQEKYQVYCRIFENLKLSGVFINADQVLGHTYNTDLLYRNDWKSKVEASHLSQQDISAAYERTKLDKMTPLPTQLNWLDQIGFIDVDCVYKYYNFVVMYAKKL